MDEPWVSTSYFIPIKTALQMTDTETGGMFYFGKTYFCKVDGDLGTV